ncbi:myeloid leukemia factor 1-like isoform X2 [Branchiostoma floridae]|uniref:Myeloid leukemia factor 1-like isoform X2 n=1 Tax=Branchiostoma floridae TaxID=7739 RepID=A0A9J7M8Z1_BRAFL|nr:myeloid leukemia factor 1-like isoform X2 [Branchiostoma floridae]
MFGGSMFDDDPFFAGAREHMRAMDQMFSGFGMARAPFHDPFLSITDGRGHRGQRNQGHGGELDMYRHRRPGDSHPTHMSVRLVPDPFFLRPFSMMDQMMSNMHSMMGNMHRNFQHMAQGAQNDPNCYSYSSSNFYSYSNTGNGPPKVYQASSSTRNAPGGVKETRRTVRDSEAGLQKMAIGHHLGERAHIVERSRDRHGEEEKQDYINLDESDKDSFNQEWQQRANVGARSVGYHGDRDRAGRRHRDRQQYRRGQHDEEDLMPVVRGLPAPGDDRVRPQPAAAEARAPQAEYHPPTPPRPKGPSDGGRKRDARAMNNPGHTGYEHPHKK